MGGFATVYKVFDLLEQQYWAMKVFAHTSAEDVLRREIASLRSVQHPHVLDVVWADKTPDGHLYLLSEFLDGETLDRYAYGPESLDDQDIFLLADQLLDALSAVHPNSERIRQLESKSLSQEEWDELQHLRNSGFVHRDVKPANLMLTASGLKLLDFNIASRVGDPIFTRSGTPAYQAPDMDLSAWAPSVDLFAAGVTVYELLCHTHPYQGGQPRADLEPIDPRGLRGDLSPRLADFLLRACAPFADQRFATAQQMRDELRNCAGVEPADGLSAPLPEGSLPSRAINDRLHEINEGTCDVIAVSAGELRELAELGGDWPAVFSCTQAGDVWATFGNQQKLQGEHGLLDLVAQIVARERRGGGRFQVSDDGVYVWALDRWVVEFNRI